MSASSSNATQPESVKMGVLVYNNKGTEELYSKLELCAERACRTGISEQDKTYWSAEYHRALQALPEKSSLARKEYHDYSGEASHSSVTPPHDLRDLHGSRALSDEEREAKRIATKHTKADPDLISYWSELERDGRDTDTRGGFSRQ